MLAALHEHGPLTARVARHQGAGAHPQDRDGARARSYSATVSAHTRVLLNLGFEGEIVRTRPTGTWVNGAYTYAAMDAWLDGRAGRT